MDISSFGPYFLYIENISSRKERCSLFSSFLSEIGDSAILQPFSALLRWYEQLLLICAGALTR